MSCRLLLGALSSCGRLRCPHTLAYKSINISPNIFPAHYLSDILNPNSPTLSYGTLSAKQSNHCNNKCKSQLSGEFYYQTQNLTYYSTKAAQKTPGWNFSLDFLSFRSLISTPTPFMLYGLGGLIPFMAAPAYMQWIGAYCPTVAHAQLVYGATILSFLGGIAWGDDVHRPQSASMQSVGYSILLPLIAWPAVLLYPHPSSFAVMIVGLGYACAKDTQRKSYPRWLKNLRFLLTFLAACSLCTTFVFSLAKSVKQDSEKPNKAIDEKSRTVAE